VGREVTAKQAAANRERFSMWLGTLFRERGFDGIGVADIMKRAGLTHGGFYFQFASKDDLAAETTARVSEGWVAGTPEEKRTHHSARWSAAYCRPVIATIRNRLFAIALGSTPRVNPGRHVGAFTERVSRPIDALVSWCRRSQPPT